MPRTRPLFIVSLPNPSNLTFLFALPHTEFRCQCKTPPYSWKFVPLNFLRAQYLRTRLEPRGKSVYSNPHSASRVRLKVGWYLLRQNCSIILRILQRTKKERILALLSAHPPPQFFCTILKGFMPKIQHKATWDVFFSRGVHYGFRLPQF